MTWACYKDTKYKMVDHKIRYVTKYKDTKRQCGNEQENSTGLGKEQEKRVQHNKDTVSTVNICFMSILHYGTYP